METKIMQVYEPYLLESVANQMALNGAGYSYNGLILSISTISSYSYDSLRFYVSQLKQNFNAKTIGEVIYIALDLGLISKSKYDEDLEIGKISIEKMAREYIDSSSRFSYTCMQFSLEYLQFLDLHKGQYAGINQEVAASLQLPKDTLASRAKKIVRSTRANNLPQGIAIYQKIAELNGNAI